MKMQSLVSARALILLILIGVGLATTSSQAYEGTSAKSVESLLLRLQARIDAQDAELKALREKVSEQGEELAALRDEREPAPAASAWRTAEESATQEDTRAESLPANSFAPAPASLASGGFQPVMSRVKTRFYGYVKLDTFYDSNRTAGGNLSFFVPQAAEGEDGGFGLTANQTRFGFSFDSGGTSYGKTTGNIEVDFYGSNSPQNKAKLRMRKAFVDHSLGDWSIRAGQDWDTLLLVHPVSIDFDNLMNHGKIGFRRPQLRISRTHKTGDGQAFLARAAISRKLGDDVDGDGLDDGVAAETPAVEGAVAWKPTFHGRPAIFGLSGHYGYEEIDDAAGIIGKDYESWSAMASMDAPLSETLSLRGTIWRGVNLDSYSGGIGQGINPSSGTEIAATGGWAQLSWRPRDNLSMHASYGVDDPDDSDLLDGQRTRNQGFTGSVFYNPVPSIEVGLEYIHLTTDYKEEEEATNNRVQATTIYKF